MSESRFFAENVIAAIKAHDLTVRADQAFCEKPERPQTMILKGHFAKQPRNIAHVEWPYENQPTTCADLFVSREAARIVAEVKAMYKTWFRINRPAVYPSYLLAPFNGYKKTNSAGFDLQRLALYTGPKTTHVAQIVIGSSRPSDNMAADLDRYTRLAHLDNLPWEAFRETWLNQHHPGYIYDIRVWIAKRDELLEEWWNKVARHYGAAVMV